MRGSSYHLWIAGTFLLSLFSGPATAAHKPAVAEHAGPEGILLRYQFEKGEVLAYRVDHQTTMITTRPELTETWKHDVHTRKTQRVVSVDETGNAKLELAIDEVRMSAQLNEEEPATFDSKNPDDAIPQYQAIRQVVGKPLAQVRVSSRGELLDMKPLIEKSTAGAQMLSGDSLSDDSARNFLIVFPEEPVEVGEVWRDTLQVKVRVNRYLTQNVTLQRTYELEEVNDGLAKITMHTALITPINDGAILAQLIQMTPKSTMRFDIENGRMLSRTTVVDKKEFGVIGGSGYLEAKSKREEHWIDPHSKPVKAETEKPAQKSEAEDRKPEEQ